MTTYLAINPDNTVSKRNSWHLYRWAVSVKCEGKWSVWRWSADQKAAVSYCNTLGRKGFQATVLQAWAQ